MKRALSNLHRFGHIFYITVHHLLAHVIGARLTWFPLAYRLKLTEHRAGPLRLRIALQEIGGTFIKFGQVLALQSDILPLEYCRELFSLLDRVPPFPFEEVERSFVQDLGRSPLEIFDTFAREPIATGSIGQVHVATLGHQKLAVKVRRPSALDDFGSDIRLMMFAVRAITTLKLKMLYWMTTPTMEFVAWTREELDFRREARYMDMIAKNAGGSSREKVPRVLWAYTTECILTADFLEGVTVLDYIRARDAGDRAVLDHVESIGFNADSFSQNLIDNFLGDAFRYGMFHADLHPANLVILPSSQVGYVDFGIAGVLSGYSRHHLIAMTLAYSRGDLGQMCESFFRVSAMDDNSDPGAFRLRLREAARDWYVRNEAEVSLRKSITAIMLELLTLSRATGIWPQRDVVKYIRSAIALDGLIKSFAPGFKVGHHLETVCDRHLRWHSVRNSMSPKSILSWVEANSCLARDGMMRTVRMLDRMAASPVTVRQPVGRSEHSAIVRIAAIALAASVLVTASHEPLTLGLNPRSAGLAVVAISAPLTLWKMYRAWSLAYRKDIDHAESYSAV